MGNYQSTKSKSQENHHLGLSGSADLQMFELPDQSFMKQTSNYSIFANNQAMSSNLSITQPDYMHHNHPFNSSETNNFHHQNDLNNNADFLPNIYGINEFEFNNASFESLPAISDKTSQSHSQFDLVDNSDWYPYPYTPTFHDNHLSNFSEGSLTSEYVDGQFLQNLQQNQQQLTLSQTVQQVPQQMAQTAQISQHLQQFPQVVPQQQSFSNSLQQTPANPNSIAKRNLTMQLQAHSGNSPHSTILPYQHLSGRSTPIAISTNFNESPTPSSNLHHAITFGAGSSTNSSSGHQQPPSLVFHSPSTATSTSPIVSLQQYKNLDMNSPILPPQHAFRHNSDSSFNSTNSSIESPRRYPSQLQPPPTSHKLSLHHNNSNLELTPPVFTPLKSISKKLSMTSLSSSDVSKPKKYTRQRLLPRSKDGCWICRIKHLKCDECKPVCKSCQRFGIECDYSEEKPLYVTDKNMRKEKLASIAQVRRSSTTILKKRSKAKLIS